MSKYSELLKDPRWQKKRLEVLNTSEWECGFCQNYQGTLHVHHLEYRDGLAPWEYANKDLIVLCQTCHDTVHYMQMTGEMVRLVAEQFRRGERHAIAMMGMSEEGSEERISYLKKVAEYTR